MESYLQRIQRAEDECDRVKGKIALLEAKLTSREDELEALRASRAQWPDVKLERKVTLLTDKVRVIVTLNQGRLVETLT